MVCSERKAGPLPAAASFRGSFASGGTADGSFREASACGGPVGFRTAGGRIVWRFVAASDDVVVRVPALAGSVASAAAVRFASTGNFPLLSARLPCLASGRKQQRCGEKLQGAHLSLKGFTS